MIQFDLFYGFYRFGKTLLKSKVGLTQGSPLSPAIADLVLQCIETKNASSFMVESRIWASLVIRWVDDIYIAMVCNNLFSAAINSRLRKRKTIEEVAIEFQDSIRKAYPCEGLGLKDEDSSFFAGFALRWNKNRFITSAIISETPGVRAYAPVRF